MEDLIREIQGLKDKIGWDSNLGDAPLTREVMTLCDLTMALARQVDQQLVRVHEHKHRLDPFQEYRTGDVIPKGY